MKEILRNTKGISTAQNSSPKEVGIVIYRESEEIIQVQWYP